MFQFFKKRKTQNEAEKKQLEAEQIQQDKSGTLNVDEAPDIEEAESGGLPQETQAPDEASHEHAHDEPEPSDALETKVDEKSETADVAKEPKADEQSATAAEAETVATLDTPAEDESETAAVAKEPKADEQSADAKTIATEETSTEEQLKTVVTAKDTETTKQTEAVALERSIDEQTSSEESKTNLDDTTSPKATTTKTPSAKDSDQSLGKKIRSGLSKTRYKFQKNLHQLFTQDETLNDGHFMQVKDSLLEADVGIPTTKKLLANLKEHCQKNKIVTPDRMLEALKSLCIDLLEHHQQALTIKQQNKPYVILMIGVNGAGKTTTIAKLTKKFLQEDHTVMLAAGDTFRAAAVEQLQIWGKRHDVPVIAQQPGADSAAVIFDALQSATAQNYNIVLADTAGRLHTKHNLMEELKKIKRVMQKIDADAPHETLLVLDACIGQNSLQQSLAFHEALTITGLVMTKLDGSAKGGALLGIADQLGVPIRYIGVGEQADDLQVFNAKSFVDAMLPDTANNTSS